MRTGVSGANAAVGMVSAAVIAVSVVTGCLVAAVCERLFRFEGLDKENGRAAIGGSFADASC